MVDSLSALEDGFDGALRLLRNISLVASPTAGTMPAQGIATYTPPFIRAFMDHNGGVPPPEGPYAPNFPEFFDEGKPFPPLWPSTERSVQNAEASIVDAFIRSIFGWRPGWHAVQQPAPLGEATRDRLISASLFRPHVPRHGFTGTLRGLRTPWGRSIDIHAGEHGLKWHYSKDSASGPVEA